MLAPAEVQCLAVKPPLGMYSVCKFLQCFLAVFACIVDYHVLRTFDNTRLEVLQPVHALIDILHDKAHVVDGACSQSKHCFVLTVGVIQHEEA